MFAKPLMTLRFRLLVTGVCATIGSRFSVYSAYTPVASQSACFKPTFLTIASQSRACPSHTGLVQSVSCLSQQKSAHCTMSSGEKFDPSDLKKRLSDMEYAVTQDKATEPPFTGKYLKNKKPGTYTCVVCGSKLFSSHHKFESGCGWPAFSEVLSSSAIKLVPDNSHGMTRTEVTCANCNAHLGHVFDDGPPPTKTRYCINSASMSFTPADNDPSN